MRRWLDDLYPTVDHRRLTIRTVLLTGLGVAVATVVNLFRTSGPGALQTLWLEDVIIFLNGAYNMSFWHVILRPEVGYFHVVPRILAEIAAAVPIRYAAPVLALEAATVWGVMAVIVFVASRPYLPRWWLRLLVAAPVVLVPVGHTQVDNDVATLQFVFLYGLFWILLWQPATRVGKVVAVVAVGLAATSGILSAVLIPLALLRLWAVRSWAARSVSLVYLAGMAMQLTSLAIGVAVPMARAGHYNPVWALKEYLITGVPRSLFGELWLGGPKVDVGGVPTAAYYTQSGTQVRLIVVALALLAAVMGCALLRVTRPHWPLAILAGVFSIAMFSEPTMIMGVVEPRYVVPPALLLYVSIVAMLRPRDGARRLRSSAPVVAFAVLIAVAAVANYRVDNARSASPAWRDKVHEAALYCQEWNPQAPYYYYGYEWWGMSIPCDRLRPHQKA